MKSNEKPNSSFDDFITAKFLIDDLIVFNKQIELKVFYLAFFDHYIKQMVWNDVDPITFNSYLERVKDHYFRAWLNKE